MSELINKAKIAEMHQINSELTREIDALREELQEQNRELEHLRGAPSEDVTQLQEKIAEYEQRERDYQERITAIIKEADYVQDRKTLVENVFSIFQQMDASPVVAAIEQYYQQQQRPKMVIAFLVGILVPLMVLVIADVTILERFIEKITRFING